MMMEWHVKIWNEREVSGPELASRLRELADALDRGNYDALAKMGVIREAYATDPDAPSAADGTQPQADHGAAIAKGLSALISAHCNGFDKARPKALLADAINAALGR